MLFLQSLNRLWSVLEITRWQSTLVFCKQSKRLYKIGLTSVPCQFHLILLLFPTVEISYKALGTSEYYCSHTGMT